MPLRHVEDYYDKVLEKFPDLKKEELDKMIKHSMRSMYMLIACGADFLLKHPKFTMYFGNLFKDKKMFMKYYLLKGRCKLRILGNRRRRIWDGYYYFILTDEQKKKYLGNKTGRLKKKIVFEEPVLAYKIPEECYLHSYGTNYYKVAWSKEEKFTIDLQGKPIREVYLVGKLNKKTHTINFVD